MKNFGMWMLALSMSIGTIGLVGCSEPKQEDTKPAAAPADDAGADASDAKTAE